jgi:DNA-binding response OmpR family regulator
LAEFKRRGVSDCLKKPVDLDVLLDRVGALAA